jgi:hypothetical protein
MTNMIDSVSVRTAAVASGPPRIPQDNGVTDRRPRGQKKKKEPGGSAQALEKAHSRQENPRKSKPFPLMVLARAWLDFARFG